MSLIAMSPSKPFEHLEVSSGIWFYMNHLKDHADAAAHDHNCLELAFILNGQAQHLSVKGEHTCQRGDVYIIPTGAWHGYAACKGLEIANCLLSPSMLQKELSWMKEDRMFDGLLGLRSFKGCADIKGLHLPAAQLVEARKLLDRLKAAYDRDASRVEILGHLLLLLEMVRAIAETESIPCVDYSQTHTSVSRALELMHQDLAHEWNLTELSAALRLNPSYLVRLFRSQTGMAPMKYLAKIRADQAATLLLSTKLRVGEIGIRIGWPEPKQFARSFRQHFGLSARDYRCRMLKPFLLGEQPPTT